MLKTTLLVPNHAKKSPDFAIDKIFNTLFTTTTTQSLTAWLTIYDQFHIQGAPAKTIQAKQRDLDQFRQFFQLEVGHDAIDNWTPAVTKHFQRDLQQTISPRTQKPYKATSINRIMATLRHFGRWLHQQRPLLAGDPFAQVKDIQTDAPDWNGLTPRQLMRLKSACEQRLNSCTRQNQNPLLETAVFYCLLGSGLRESELVALDVYQYHNRGLDNAVRHKSKRVSTRVPLPRESREWLDRYLMARQAHPNEPLFINRYGNRLKTLDVYRLCQRVLKQAVAFLPVDEQFRFTPHQLRHTFLKKVADKHGVHFAHELSGNVSIKEIFRYAKPSQDEMQQTIEQLFQV